VIGSAGLLVLVFASLSLAALAVLIDRLNFPQRPFRARSVPLIDGKVPRRDRTGAHVIDEDEPTVP
jgi:hypothetical protein